VFVVTFISKTVF